MSCRSFAEYAAFFDLDLAALRGRRVLDCCAGAASFVAEAAAERIDAVAVDPVYAMPRDQLATLAGEGLTTGSAIAVDNADRFTWDWYGSREARDTMRRQALARFLVDLAARPERYVAATLPDLPFADAELDLALCSHLLFTWAEELGESWHRAAIRELARVAREVRIFPTVLQGRGERVPFWTDLMAGLEADGLSVATRTVPYEFQRGADTMLVVGRPAG